MNSKCSLWHHWSLKQPKQFSVSHLIICIHLPYSSESRVCPMQMYQLIWVYMPIFFVLVNTFSCLWVPVLKFSLPFQLQNLGLGSTSSSPPQKFHQESKNRHYLVDYRDTSQTLYISCDTDSIVLHTVYLPCNKSTGFIPTFGQPFVTDSHLTRFPQKKKKNKKKNQTKH